MKRKILSVLLSVVLLFSAVSAVQFQASAVTSTLGASDSCISLLKALEGFSAKPYWDYSQYSVGYGTRCPDEDYDRYMENGIPEEEADALLRQYVSISERWLNRFADQHDLTFSQQQFDALVLFTYNCGTGWMQETDGTFYAAVVNRATGNEFLYALCRWCVAGGQVQSFLLDRRMKEANIYLNGVYSTAVSDQFSYVRYSGNGGTVSSSVQGYDVTNPPAPIPTAAWSGHTFSGWYTAAQGGRLVTALDGSVKGKTLYAHWDETQQPTEPEPTEPEPTVPAPTEPKPTEPVQKSVEVTVTGDYVNVRKGPGTGYDVVTGVSAGQKLTITETAEGSGYTWGKFSSGWICLKYTNYDKAVSGGDTPAPAQPVMGTVYDASTLRIRSGPGTSYSIVGYLSSGTRVEILEQTDNGLALWGKISKGWICMDYVKLDSTSGSGETVIATGVVYDTDELRIRSGAGLHNSVVGYLNGGDKVEIYEKASSDGMVWGRTAKGWISLDYVKLDGSGSDTVIATGSVINTNSLRIRSAAGTDHEVLGYLTMGTRVEIYERMTVGSMVWGRISDGWISLDYVKLDSGGMSGSTKTVTASSLRIRSAAGTDSEIVGYLTNGTKVKILEQTYVDGTPWGRIDEGWICLDYVE